MRTRLPCSVLVCVHSKFFKQFDVFSPKLIYILCQFKAVYFVFPVVSKKTGADTQTREVGTIIII